ncbi:hypothetical protein GCM10027051_29180 [Niabella terrae]
MPEIRTIDVTRYVTPLREGGSLPAIAEGSDGFLYALKFRGAGQGPKALVAEFIGGEIARALGLKVPEIVLARLDAAFGRTEGDEEIQDLLKASQGINIALHYLSGSISYDPAVMQTDAMLASKIVWLDAYLMNMDRTARNTNMLIFNRELWLIDHGACLYFHHNWSSWEAQRSSPFALIKDHVLLKEAALLEAADQDILQQLDPVLIDDIIEALPEDWLHYEEAEGNAATVRAVYKNFLKTRLEQSVVFVKQAQDARAAII